MNATSKLVYPGPTATHRYASVATRPDAHPAYGTLIGWAETQDIANQAADDFLNSPAVNFKEATGHE